MSVKSVVVDPCQKKDRTSAEKPEKPGDSSFLGFSLLFGRWKAWKSQETMQIPGFVGKAGTFFQEKPEKPGEGSWLSRKAWILSIHIKPRKTRRATDDCARCGNSWLS